MKNNVSLLCLLLLFCASCTTTNSAYISQQEKQLLISQLERKVDDKVGGPYSQSVLKFDLLQLSQQQANCQSPSVYALLNQKATTREAYRQQISRIEGAVDAITLPREPLIRTIYQRAEQKTRKLQHIVKLAQLTSKDFQPSHPSGKGDIEEALFTETGMGGPYISARRRHIEEGEEDILSNFTTVSNTQALSQQLNTLERLSVIADALPLASPLPSAVQTSGFSIRRDPINHKMAKHEGVDLVGKENAQIYSTAPGVVAFTGRLGGYGNLVIINHGFGITTRYGHLKEIWVQQGDNVAKVQPIGIQGNTGRTTAAHLHYEVRFNDRPHNPNVFLKIGEGCDALL